jgi:hypothetical protein
MHALAMLNRLEPHPEESVLRILMVYVAVCPIPAVCGEGVIDTIGSPLVQGAAQSLSLLLVHPIPQQPLPLEHPQSGS